MSLRQPPHRGRTRRTGRASSAGARERPALRPSAPLHSCIADGAQRNGQLR
ncbi:MAG: hypothetical protein OJF60_001651 [Burkholderiaceae bacterium]|nr:MAG: hypothetical protein OJF60_001651 [Burkholderiaceae bacterium]